MPTGYSTIIFSNGAITTVSNFETDEENAGEWDKQVIDNLALEIPKLIARSQWIFEMPKDKLLETIESELAVDSWAARGAYGAGKKYLHWKLHRNLEWSLEWARRDLEGEMICRVLFCMACEALYSKEETAFTRLGLTWQDKEEKTA
jgi:hypothetical protein